MSTVAPSGVQVARAIRAAVEGEFSVKRFGDERETHWIDLMSWKDRPEPGQTTHSTLSLHLSPNLFGTRDTRVEFLGVADDRAIEFPNLLATAAFFVMKDGWSCGPEAVFPGLIHRYFPRLSSTLQHVLFVDPFLWEQLGSVEITDELSVHWLHAIPISEGELQFMTEHGYDRLQNLFEERDVAYYDLTRPSIV